MRIGLVLALLMFCCQFLGSVAREVQASHPFNETPTFPIELGRNSYLFPDLEAGGDQLLIYSVCGTPLPAHWITGVENWDSALPGEFQQTLCTFANTVLTWEGTAVCDNDEAVACWNFEILLGPHGSHIDMLQSSILFDRGRYQAQTSQMQRVIAAHEWGHNMDLAEHTGVLESQCASNTLMAPVGIEGVCLEGPSQTDVWGVQCAYIDSTDCDGDGFTNRAESTIPLCDNGINDDAFEDIVVDDGCWNSMGYEKSGFWSEAEVNLGTDRFGRCGPGATAGPSAHWPLDLQQQPGADLITIGEFNTFLNPLRPTDDGHGIWAYFGHRVIGDPLGGLSVRRWNLDWTNSGLINIADLNAINPAVVAPTSRPPMFGGAPAFGHAACTGHPVYGD